MSKHQFKENIAVVIGINNYQNGIPALGTAKEDAEAIAEILEKDYHYSIHSIIDDLATKQQLEKLLNIDLPEQIHTPSSRLIFYFAGHGIALNGDEGPQGYLIPQDGKLGDVSTYLPMQTVEAALSKLSCRHCFVILDCCFAGAFRWSSTRRFIHIPKTIHKERYDRFIQDSAWQVITSAGYDQTALDNLDLKNDRGTTKNQVNHSPFAKALMEALQGKADVYPPSQNGKPAGDGIITATELYLYLRDSVEIPTDALKKRQTPQIWSLNKHDKGEFIFLVPGHPLNLPSAPSLDDVEENNPYRGLFSYEKKHSNLFFGRTSLIKELYAFISHPQRPLTVVLGASGSGKSSLVKAGLIPYLDPLHQWKTLTPIRPGETPLTRLNSLIKELDDNSKTLHQGITNWSKNHPNQKLLLVIDQLEELVTLSRDETQIEHFSAILANLVTTHATYLKVVITLRSDFESQFSNKLLTNYWQEGRFLVPAMSRNDLREVIEEPASAKVVYFQSLEDKGYLVDRLIDEVADMPGALPLLSFALSELYLKLAHRYLEGQKTGNTVDRAITWQDYDELGGVIKSLTRRADEEYDALVKEDAAYETTIPHVMLRMVAIGGELARRRVYQKELVYPDPEYGRVKAFIKRFDGMRLLISNQDEKGEYVEPAHDALVTGWEKLLRWKKEEEETLILQRKLTPAAMEWEQVKDNYKIGLFDKANPLINSIDRILFPVENLLLKLIKIPADLIQKVRHSQHEKGELREKPTQFLWNSHPYLDVLNQELHGKDNWLDKAEREFIEASVLQKRRNGSWRWRIVIAVMLGLSGLTIFAGYQWRKSEISQILALKQASEAKLLLEQDLDSLIDILRATKTLKKSLLLQLFKPETQLQNQVELTLHKAIYQVKEKNIIKIPNEVNEVIFSPNDQLLAILQFDGTVSLLERTGKLSSRFKPFNVGGEVQSITFSADSQKLITVSTDEVVKYWDLNGQQIGKDLKQPGIINEVMLGSNGKVMIFSNNKLRDLESGTLLAEFPQEIGYGTLSPDGKLIAPGWAGDTITIWNVDSQKEIVKIEDFPFFNSNIPVSISFSPDSKLIAAAGYQDDTIYLWNLKGHLLAKFKANQGGVADISFSPDGKQLATVGVDKTIRIWQDVEGKQLRQMVEYHDSNDGYPTTMALSSDGQTLAVSNRNNKLSLWNLSNSQKTELPQKFASQKFSSVSELHFSPDNRSLAVSESKGTIHWLDLESRQTINSFTVEEASDGNYGSFVRNNYGYLLQGISFSQQSEWLAVGGDNNIVIWSSDGQEQAKFPEDVPPEEGYLVPSWVQATSFNPSGNILATGGIGHVHLWNWKEGKSVLPKPIDAHTTQTRSVIFSPTGNLIATEGLDGSIPGVRLWNLSGQKLAEFDGHKGWVNQIVFSPDETLFATASSDNTIRIWDLSGQQLMEFQAGYRVRSIAFTLDSKQLVTVEDGPTFLSVKWWEIEDFDELSVRGCEWVHDYLKNNPELKDEDRHLCDGII